MISRTAYFHLLVCLLCFRAGDVKESFNDGILPTSLRCALIALHPQVGRPNKECGNLRPITLSANLGKYRCKCSVQDSCQKNERNILKNNNRKRSKCLYSWQAGFYFGGIMNIIDNHKGAPDTALLSVNAKKAFKGVEFLHLSHTLAQETMKLI